MHLNISRPALFNISPAGSFPASLFANSTKKSTVQDFIRLILRMVRNLENVTVGLQEITFAKLQ